MWVFLSGSFLSVAADADDASKLLVRARLAGDIELVFPGVRVESTPGRDYLYRAAVPRERVAEALAVAVRSISYPSLKDAVADPMRHDAYRNVWSAMAAVQKPRPYSVA
jgi:hypothetical protein